MKNHISETFYVSDRLGDFLQGIQLSINQIVPQGVFAGDNLFTIHRNLSFLDDPDFMMAFEANRLHDESYTAEVERSVIWRTHVLAWAAHHCLRVDGDFVECACYRGTSAKILCDYLGFSKTSKHYYLYDLFEHDDTMQHHTMALHGVDLFDYVRRRFSAYPNVHVVKGSVPHVLREVSPQKIAFIHLDLNNAAAEVGALEVLFDRVLPGGVIVLDDYGWLAYREQKIAIDAFLASYKIKVLELPTGQGLVLK